MSDNDSEDDISIRFRISSQNYLQITGNILTGKRGTPKMRQISIGITIGLRLDPIWSLSFPKAIFRFSTWDVGILPWDLK